MKHGYRAILTLVLAIIFVVFANQYAYSALMAFLEAEDEVPVEDESEYKWAADKYAAILIHPANAGKFQDDNGKDVSLNSFQIVWWHRANSKDIPKFFLENSTKDAFMNYVKGGGSLFLSQVALHYVADLGLESTPIRFCDPNVDHAVSGIMAAPGQEKHPIFAGFDKMGVNPAAGSNIDCYGHDCMCDFYPSGPAKEGTIVGMEYQEPHPQAWFGQVTPLCEYKVGNGTIIISGWRFTVFRSGEEGCKHHNNMVKLHENIMAYLYTLSAVDAKEKAPIAWGMIKKSNM